MSTALQNAIIFFSVLTFTGTMTTTGFVIKNFFDAKKHTEGIEQNGKQIVALTAKVAKDHKDIIEKLDENTRAILAGEQRILNELKEKQDPPKAGSVAAPMEVNANQQNNENVQRERSQERELLGVVKQYFHDRENEIAGTKKAMATEDRAHKQQLQEIQKKCDDNLNAITEQLLDKLHEAAGDKE